MRLDRVTVHIAVLSIRSQPLPHYVADSVGDGAYHDSAPGTRTSSTVEESRSLSDDSCL